MTLKEFVHKAEIDFAQKITHEARKLGLLEVGMEFKAKLQIKPESPTIPSASEIDKTSYSFKGWKAENEWHHPALEVIQKLIEANNDPTVLNLDGFVAGQISTYLRQIHFPYRLVSQGISTEDDDKTYQLRRRK